MPHIFFRSFLFISLFFALLCCSAVAHAFGCGATEAEKKPAEGETRTPDRRKLVSVPVSPCGSASLLSGYVLLSVSTPPSSSLARTLTTGLFLLFDWDPTHNMPYLHQQINRAFLLENQPALSTSDKALGVYIILICSLLQY